MDHVASIRAEAQRMADALATTDPSAPVPTCPDWSAADLLWHLTTVHAFWAAVLREDPQGAQVGAIEEAAPQRPGTLAEMLQERARHTEDLCAQLTALDDDQARWSWWQPDQSVGFTRRMQTAEALMHRVDAELTAGLPLGPMSADAATLAVDHAIDVMHAWQPPDAAYDAVGLLDLRAEDTGQWWRVEIGSWSGTNPWTGDPLDGHRVRRLGAGRVASADELDRVAPGPEHDGAAMAVVRGELADLARWIWTRPAQVTLDGDESVRSAVDALHAAGIA